MDQDNFYYSDDDWPQANMANKYAGKDNDAAGFNDQSRYVLQAPLIRCLKDAAVVSSTWRYDVDRDTVRHKITSKDM